MDYASEFIIKALLITKNTAPTCRRGLQLRSNHCCIRGK